MIDGEMEKVTNRSLKLGALDHAREPLRQLVRELNGEPPRPAGRRYAAQLLRRQIPLGIPS
jgi:hypothetical protein